MYRMDDLATHSNDPTRTADLAAIVLGDGARLRAEAAPEQVPVAHGSAAAEVDGRYDVRSVLVLALVVAALAAVVGWTTSLGHDERIAPIATSTKPSAAPDAVTRRPAVTPAARAVVAPRGVDLVPGRIVASRSGSGGGIVRVAVANRGREAYEGTVGAQVLLLVDGQVAGTESLGRLDAGESTTVEFALDSCPSGTPALVAVVDPAARVREADERANSVSRTASFGC